MHFMSLFLGRAILDMVRECELLRDPRTPEEALMNQKIEDMIYKADLFIVQLRVVDEGMINKVFELVVQKQALSSWSAASSPTVH